MRKKIDVMNLKVGMYVEELDRPWLGTPFLLQGLHLQSESDIKEVQSLCRYVYVSSNEEVDAANASSNGTRSTTGPAASDADSVSRRREKLERFGEHVEKATEIRDKAKALVDTMHDDIRAGRQIDPEEARDLVGEMVANVTYDPDAMVWLTHLKNRDEYTALHSINVCTLTLVFGSHLGLDVPTLHEIGLGALLHDIGKLRVPLEVLNKPGKLTEQEYDTMKQHPDLGMGLLTRSTGLSRTVLDVVHSHHERILGQGYPRGLKGDAIPEHTQIVSIVDVYDALTSDRVYRNGMPTAGAMRLMHEGQGSDFAAALLEQFTRCLGLFPGGSLVELSTGEVGVVIHDNGKHVRAPMIMLILDPEKRKYYPLRILDLKLFSTSATAPKIHRILPPGSFGLQAVDFASEIASVAT